MSEDELVGLYERFGHLVRRRCLALLGNEGDADDALQDAFLKAYRYHHTQEGPAALGWLYAIANRACHDLARKRGREAPSQPDIPMHPDSPDWRAVMPAVLRRIDPETCEIGILHHLEGLTQEEIVPRTGFSRRTVGKKLALFEAELRERWKAAGGGE